jgi:hypothetical protein
MEKNQIFGTIAPAHPFRLVAILAWLIYMLTVQAWTQSFGLNTILPFANTLIVLSVVVGVVLAFVLPLPLPQMLYSQKADLIRSLSSVVIAVNVFFWLSVPCLERWVRPPCLVSFFEFICLMAMISIAFCVVLFISRVKFPLKSKRMHQNGASKQDDFEAFAADKTTEPEKIKPTITFTHTTTSIFSPDSETHEDKKSVTIAYPKESNEKIIGKELRSKGSA